MEAPRELIFSQNENYVECAWHELTPSCHILRSFESGSALYGVASLRPEFALFHGDPSKQQWPCVGINIVAVSRKR